MAGVVALEEEALPRLPEELWPLIFLVFASRDVGGEGNRDCASGAQSGGTHGCGAVADSKRVEKMGVECGAEVAALASGGNRGPDVGYGIVLFGVGELGGEDCD